MRSGALPELTKEKPVRTRARAGATHRLCPSVLPLLVVITLHLVPEIDGPLGLEAAQRVELLGDGDHVRMPAGAVCGGVSGDQINYTARSRRFLGHRVGR
jgi:hypothetical protein